jgi:hypothetical protein
MILFDDSPGAADQAGGKCATEFTPSCVVALLQGLDFGRNDLSLATGTPGEAFRQKLKRVKSSVLF